jgi:Na+/melibiose symporter-like transporter
MQEETIVIDTSNIKRDAMEKKHSFAYSVGHFSNDLCAAGWFFYFTYYLKYVIKMDGGQAGLVMLAGQIADGCTTPLVGLLSDKCKTPLGSRAPWYIVGTMIVLPCFFCIFLSPMGVGNPNINPGDADPDITTGKVAFYIAMASLFNVGWASVQIANMSVVNSITYSTQKRDTLVASRNTFTFIANIAVLVTSLILFSITKISAEVQFRILGSIIVAVGLASSLIYMIVLKEPYLSKEAKRL